MKQSPGPDGTEVAITSPCAGRLPRHLRYGRTIALAGGAPVAMRQHDLARDNHLVPLDPA